MWNDCTVRPTTQPSLYISCPLSKPSKRDFMGFYSFWKIKLYWLNSPHCRITPKLNHYVINRNKGSQRRRIPNPIPSSAWFSHRERMTVHEASGLKLHARAHETQNSLSYEKTTFVTIITKVRWMNLLWILFYFWNTFCFVFPALRTTW